MEAYKEANGYENTFKLSTYNKNLINGEKFNHYVGDKVKPVTDRKEIKVGI